MSANDFVIDVQGITKRFGNRTVVNNIPMRVRHGEIYGFLGPNGSGKTTFLRMLCGLLRPDGGSGRCLGFDIRSESGEIKKNIGYMTQRFSFYEDLTLEENLDFIARIYGVPERKAAVEKSLEQLGMTARRRQLAGTLSGGWNHRLAYIAYGNLLARGSVAEVVKAAGLTTFEVTGENLVALAEKIRGQPGV